uniref:Uncharacterized protein n=1 Tax=Melopsittacus undulatus TaxID=13146 RepID=A0A8V5GF17_MELUD
MSAPGLPLPPTSLPQHWGCRGPPDPEGYSSSSPAASPDSCGLSSPSASRGPRSGPRGRKGARAAAGGPRQSASEREKLRMRRLAQALGRLRHYLPPALAPAGHSLTKIQTLRLAARYIAHLSALLGLGEEALGRRRGAAPRHCPLCPRGLGCCRSPEPRPLPPAPAPSHLLGAGGGGPGAWGSSAPCGAAAGPPLGVLGVPDVGPGAWGSDPYVPSMRTPPELYGSAVTPDTCSWPSPLHGAGASPDLPGDPLLDAGLMLPECVDAGTVTQDLSADLLSLLEALLPPQHQD